MKNASSPRPIASTLLAFALCLSTHADSGLALFVDGKVRTDGVPLNGTYVMVERDGVMIQMLTDDIARIHMRLELQRIYVFSFERYGCMTKKLLFDTHVPAENLMDAPFSFPFKVTLEANEASSVLHYAQPVGFVRYFEAQKDFGYDRNYTMRRDKLPSEDLIALRSPVAEEPLSSEPAHTHAPTAEGRPSANASSGVTPMMARPAPIEKLPARPTPTLAIRPASADVEPVIATVAAPMTRPATGSTMRMTKAAVSAIPAKRKHAAITRPLSIPRKDPVVLPDGRTEELQVEPTYVATTVRITNAGYTREYRRVAHKYGAVHYFFNGNTCGEATYFAGINEH